MTKRSPVKGWIDVKKPSPEVMQPLPMYPLWGVILPVGSHENRDLVLRFIEKREDESWLLIGKDTLCSEEQIWTVWLGVQRRKMQGCMRSNSIDGEMLRLLSGTHHVSAGIKRAGISESDAEAWIVHIPPCEEEGVLPTLDMAKLDKIAQKLALSISAEFTESRPTPTINGLIRLQIISPDGANSSDDIADENITHGFDLSDDEICDLMIATIASSDLQG